MNNAKVPLGMAVSLLIFKESADLWRLTLAGAALLLAVLLCEWPRKFRSTRACDENG
jgi:hypothetical protein